MESDNDIKEDGIIDNLRRTMTGYEFNLRGIATKIKIRLDKVKKTGKVAFSQSHFIHSPSQATPYETDHSWGYDEQEALNLALDGYRRFYKMAIEAGNKPNDSWLVLNTRFKWQ